MERPELKSPKWLVDGQKLFTVKQSAELLSNLTEYIVSLDNYVTFLELEKANDSTRESGLHISDVTQHRELLSKFYRHLCDIAVIDSEYRTEYDKKTIPKKFTL